MGKNCWLILGDLVKIVVMGAGAIGSLVGGLLAKAGNEVCLVGREAHVHQIRQDGLVIEDIAEDLHIQLRATTSPAELDAPDLIIITVKAYDTAQAVEDVKGLFQDQNYLLCLQNGLGTEDVAASILGKERIILCKARLY